MVCAKSATARDLSAAQADLRDLSLQAERDQQVAQRGIAAIEQELTENEARRELVVRAPKAGRVTAITAEPGQTVTLEITREGGKQEEVPVKLRIDTPIEIDYYRHGGILPFVLRELMARK